MATFDDATRTLLDRKNFATLTTLNADGAPQSSVVWFVREGDALLVSATAGKLKVRNLTRDPRVSVAVFDIDNPYHSVAIRGRAELTDDPEKALPVRLSQRYLGVDPPDESESEARVVITVIPERVAVFSA